MSNTRSNRLNLKSNKEKKKESKAKGKQVRSWLTKQRNIENPLKIHSNKHTESSNGNEMKRKEDLVELSKINFLRETRTAPSQQS